MMFRRADQLPATPSFLSIMSLTASLVLLNSVPIAVGTSHAQVPPPPVTSSGLNTQISAPTTLPTGQVNYNITGGTRPGGGPNLFHSFGEFGVPTNNIANFLNETPNLATSNILGRVTGGNPSNIFGTIQTTGFGNANLFLMNPSGFLFGPNATANVGGMVAFTSADYLKLTDNARFNAIPNAAADALLTALPVASFGFLGSNPGAITVQGSQFTVTQGTGISLVGGNITIQSGTLDDGTVQLAKLTGPAGQINLASAASPGEILSSNLQLGANVNGKLFTSLGGITISQDARIDSAGATDGTIAIRGGQLTITDGATIATAPSSSPSVPAGSVTIRGAGVQMTGSDVVINGTNVSVTGSKVTAANLDGSGGTIAIKGGSADHPGNVTVAQNALLDVSGTRGGSITIRGSQLAISDATLSADTGNTNGVLTAIDINVTGDLSITDTRGIPVMTARTMGTGDPGEIRLTSGNLVATSSFDPFPLTTTLIDSHTSGDGRGGDVHITTGNLTVAGPNNNAFFFIDSGTVGNGRGGNISLQANMVDLNWISISTGQFNVSPLLADTSGVNGSAGNLTIAADTLQLKNSILNTSAFLGLSEIQKGGDVTLNARDISMMNTQVGSTGLDGGGTFVIKADRLVTDFTFFETVTVSGPGGGIKVNARAVDLTNGSALISSTFGNGNAGDIYVTATDHVNFIGRTGPNPQGVFVPSGLFGNSFGASGNQGNAGNVVVTTPRLEMIGGRINTVTASSGGGGNVTLTVQDVISISGEFLTDPSIVPSIFDIGPLAPSGIVTQTIGSGLCTGLCGHAGNISITTGSLNLGSGAQIDSGTSSTGGGGDIAVHATNQISMSGTQSNGSPVGVFSRSLGTQPDSGAGGNIALTAGQSVAISNGASVSASSTGPGNTGSIQINAGNQFAMTNSSVTTQANLASGGTIKITTTPSGTVQLTNSTISASVLDGTGGGGSVNIDPQFVVLLNSQILAQAVQGPGGNISITTNLLLPDANSVISASSQFGLNGTVTIQSPNDPAGGKIQPLGKTPLQATSLFNQRCASLAGGEFSSFTVAGRDSLPTEPGSWLASPLYAAGVGEGQGVRGKGVEGLSASAGLEGDAPILSLRQIAPVGFLTQAFAVDWSAGCQS